MRILKKIIFIVLALLPIIPLIFGILSVAFNDNFVSYEGFDSFIIDIIPSRVSIVEDIDEFRIVIQGEPNIIDTLFLDFFTDRSIDINEYVINQIYTLPNVLPLTLTTGHYFAWSYMLYMLFVVIINFIFDLISFVPRKCSEIFIN